MTTLLYLARHGQTDWNCQGRYQGQIDIPLNDRGREEARSLAEKLQQSRPVAIWASDLSRARETAAIVAAPHNLPVQIHPGLREMHFGSWQGLTWQQIEQRFPEAWRLWTEDPLGYNIPGAESVGEMETRFKQALLEICGKYPGGTVFVVTHGGPMSRLLSELAADEFWEMLQGNCACNMLRFCRDRFQYLGPAPNMPK
ncbi:MAG TPA: alpha-ribazole phosphatase [Firmicutes bacterium]|jgi:alpha-ribazole phosphatase/probable phosphoglycerate mutase|nr:alpha-ribazole phosphatase [Bacillota bacterium]